MYLLPKILCVIHVIPSTQDALVPYLWVYSSYPSPVRQLPYTTHLRHHEAALSVLLLEIMG